ncbi:MAG: hypothetical protein LBI62_08150 [Candidatus Accumulibacter sp.]|jgi:hypothetical protein|nr:hypothetical protein [Accumulibacter sp.]
MSSRFEAAVAAICAESGWTPAESPNDARQVHFTLPEMEFTLSAPDDRYLRFLHLLAVAPDETPSTMARALAHMAAAAAHSRKTILSFHKDAFYLHLIVDLATTRPEEIPVICQAFLNDCDWWRQNRSFYT